ncbi:MAG: glutamate--cysteine ligase, partial [Planctomycetota bacterium]
FELNVRPQKIAGNGLLNMRAELRATWSRCQEVARRMDCEVVSIGILPTVQNVMLNPQNMSPLKRYAALNRQVLLMRGGTPLTLKIDGLDSLHTTHNDLMLESAATSIQVHLKVGQSESVRFYNSSLIASALTTAMAANAPLLFGRRLWDDSRIPLFEQAVDTGGKFPRVSFGRGYVRHSLLELFERNLSDHRILLPAELDQGPARMPYVRMHNGTIWNWNRPLIGFEPDGTPHLRIEHRPMSASPSSADLFADVAFYLGLVHHLAGLQDPPENRLPFEVAKENFYAAAKASLSASITWIDGRQHCISELVRDRVLPVAMEQLVHCEVSSELIEQAEAVLRGRLDRHQNGAIWQRRKFDAYSGDAVRLLREYIQRQNSQQPVCEWN